MFFTAHTRRKSQRRTNLASILLLCFFWVSSTFGAVPEYLHQIWRTEDGIPDPIVRKIVQSRDGYLWLATEESLLRFDGVRFIEIDRKTSPDKIDRWFTALVETRDGAIWSSSPNGGLRWWKNGQKKLYQIKDGLPSNYIMSLCEDRQGALWIGTDIGLSCFKDGKFVNYTNEISGLVRGSVRALLEDHSGKLWIGTSRGVCVRTTGGFESHTNKFAVNPSIMSLSEDRQNRLWIGTAKGVTMVENGAPTHFTEADGLAHGTVRGVIEDEDGKIWVGSQGGVQLIIDGKLVNPVIHSTADFEDAISFVYTIFQDHEGNVWVGTNLGLNRLKPQRFSILSKENGLGNNVATLVYQDRSGTKWVGTYGGGLTRIKDGELKTFTTADGLASNFILALCEDHNGNLWIGTDGAGLVRYRDGKFTQYVQSQDLRMNTVRVIYEDRAGNLWIGSNSSIGRFANGEFINENIVIVSTRVILEDHSGSLWVGSRTGLMRWKDGKVTTYMKKDGLAATQINALYEDTDGTLWIGTDGGGLTRFRDEKFTSLGAAEGLFNERVLHLLDDNYGNLWMGTRVGIFSVPKKDLNDLASGKISAVKLLSFGKKEGLKRAQCNGIAQPSGWKMNDGSLSFVTMHGAVSFDPREVASNKLPPLITIEHLSVDGKPVQISSLIEVPPGQGQVEIEYTALSFQQPERVHFRYKLEGFDSDWQDGGNRRTATYNNLKPREYEFHVIACNNDGVWNEAGASVAFILQPHFYQTYTFYVGCVLVLGVSSFGVYRLRIQHLRKHEKHLSALVEERTKALQQEISERKQAEEALRQSQEMLLRQERLAVVGQLAAGIAHEFNNILTIVQGHTCMLMTSEKLSDDDRQPLEKISVAADRAAHLTKQLLTFSRKQMMQIRPLNLNDVVNNMTSMLKRVLGEQIILEFKYCPRNPIVCADVGMMEQVVINLAVNARDAMPKGGHLVISVETKEILSTRDLENPEAREGSFGCLSVTDTGCGIPAENLKKIFEPFFTTKEVGKGTGLGLATVYGIAKQHQGWIDVESEVDKGTTFTLYLPIASESAKAKSLKA